MLARRPLILSGALAGVALSCLSALVLGAPGSALGRLDALQTRLVAIRGPGANAGAETSELIANLLTPPLFGQVVAITLRLDGVSILPGRKAALIAINGQPADWIELGDTRDGVTLVDVQPARVSVDTDAGPQNVNLGEGPPAAAVPQSPAAPTAYGQAPMPGPKPAMLQGSPLGLNPAGAPQAFAAQPTPPAPIAGRPVVRSLPPPYNRPGSPTPPAPEPG